jgi:hypothetical protein
MTKNLKRLLFYFGYVFLVWGSFRYFIRLPEVIEELWFKPVIWLAPLFWWQLSLGRKIRFFEGDWEKTLLFGLLGGLIYFVILRLFVQTQFAFEVNKAGISAVTAIVEELTFSGFVLSLLVLETKKEGMALGLTALGFALIHLPINLFVFHLPAQALAGAFLLAFFVGLINGFLRLRSNNVLSAVIAHFVYLLFVLV